MPRSEFALRHYKRGVKTRDGKGRKCLHCGRSATWAGYRRSFGKKMPVRYCDEHKAQLVDA